MRRIGIFGGSFNPVHKAHLALARQAKRLLRLDEIIFVPCNRSAYRKKLLPARLRLRMLRAALRGVDGFKVSDVEIRMGGVSRSIDTLKALQGRIGAGAKFFLLIGEDQAKEFPKWKQAAELSKLSQVCVMARPGFRKAALIHKKYHFKTIKVSQYEISSTEIRRRLKQGMPVAEFLEPKVLSILKSLKK